MALSLAWLVGKDDLREAGHVVGSTPVSWCFLLTTSRDPAADFRAARLFGPDAPSVLQPRQSVDRQWILVHCGRVSPRPLAVPRLVAMVASAAGQIKHPLRQPREAPRDNDAVPHGGTEAGAA